jgi:hypothetical protein
MQNSPLLPPHLAAADYEKRRQKELALLDRVRTYYKENTLD